MERGKDIRDPTGKSVKGNAPREVVVLQYVLVEKSPGAFTLRFVTNQELLDQLRGQGALQGFLEDADQLYAEVHLGAVFVVQFDRPACLPLRIKASFAVDDDVIRLAGHKPRLRVGAGNKGTVEGIALVVEGGVELEVVDGKHLWHRCKRKKDH